MTSSASGLRALTPNQARTLAAAFNRMFPPDEDEPGAVDIGAVAYTDAALAGPYCELLWRYRQGLAVLASAALTRHRRHFEACSGEEQDGLLQQLEHGTLPDLDDRDQVTFFALLRAHLQEGLFSDPVHGGNRDKLGWRFLKHPGVWLENSAEENLSPEPVTKGGEIRSLADVRSLDTATVGASETHPSASHPVRGDRDADVVVVGVGAMGSLAAWSLARAGVRVVGLEAGPWRTIDEYVPDELTSAYYCRGDMGRKFLNETPRWRRSPDVPTEEAVFSLGRMMNGVGGSVVHWGGALRRFHPHHFRYLTHVRERSGLSSLPEGHSLVDWPLQYGDLEPYYTRLEYAIGVAGDGDRNPFVPRSRPLPLPPLRPFTGGLLFEAAAQRLGLHPYPTPVAVNSRPYNRGPESSYCAWMGGFGPFRDDRWYPGMTWVPEAIESGNLDLRTGCRALRILTDPEGRARGVEYADDRGEVHIQRARAVILAGYTFENVRLLFLSGTTRSPEGLGNSTGQLGKHFMIKSWDDVHGYLPDVVFNAHTGPAAQMWGLDDWVSEGFDPTAHGFIGGATPNVENQQLPIQISREQVPPDVRPWGLEYRRHLERWQHVYAIRLQPETLSYQGNELDLDSRHRDRSGFGLPVIRVTYDIRANEERAADWAEAQAQVLLREMGASKTWPGPRICRVCSSHDLGGCRMGEDPGQSVVSPDLEAHDTPGLFVFSGATFPTCPGVNPTLTMWAVCLRAAERLRSRLATERG